MKKHMLLLILFKKKIKILLFKTDMKQIGVMLLYVGYANCKRKKKSMYVVTDAVRINCTVLYIPQVGYLKNLCNFSVVLEAT